MTILKAHLNSLEFATKLEEVNKLLDTAKTKISFWGTRLVEMPGYTGSVTLNNLSERMVSAAQKRCNDNNLTTPERITGIEIAGKLKNLYQITDAQIKSSNFLTRLINWLREFRLFFSQLTSYSSVVSQRTSYSIVERCFETYRKDDFIKQFGKEELNLRILAAKDDAKIVADPDRIRAQLMRA